VKLVEAGSEQGEEIAIKGRGVGEQERKEVRLREGLKQPGDRRGKTGRMRDAGNLGIRGGAQVGGVNHVVSE
jgi:hypothetical protein